MKGPSTDTIDIITYKVFRSTEFLKNGGKFHLKRAKVMVTVRFELTPLPRSELESDALDQLGHIT